MKPKPGGGAPGGGAPRGLRARRTYRAEQGELAEPLPRAGIFPTFFMAGFECSTFIWKDGQRRDYVQLTGHDAHLEGDLRRVKELGIDVVRESIRWPLVDRGGRSHDWSSVEPVLDALGHLDMVAIWDLCHYGFPDGCNPLDERTVERFADYCRAAAEVVVPRTPKPRYFTPVNEITFTAGATTDMGWFWPFAKGEYDAMKRALCRMAIEGVKAIRRVDPEARMVHVDPVIHLVPPPDRPDLAKDAQYMAYVQPYEAWDMLCGTLHPELGGAPEILDIVGVNVYHFSQAMMKADGSREILGPRDPRRRPLGEQLKLVWDRYRRPVIIGETSGYEDRRAEWFRMVMEESMRALNSGIDLQGTCLYPCVDIPDWESGEPAKIGLFDLCDTDEYLREPCEDYMAELREWQRILDQPREARPVGGRLDNDADGRVQLHEVRRHAREWEERTPGRQTVDGDRDPTEVK